MQVICILLALEKFQSLFQMISLSFQSVTFLYASFCIAFAERNDINIFKIIETRHFDSSNYISVIGEVHPLNLIDELLLVLFISLIFDISIHERKKKLCNQNFAGSPISPDVTASPSMEEFSHYSKDKITCKTDLHFCELNMKTRKSLRAVSLSASSLTVYSLYYNLNFLYLHDSTQCSKQMTTLVQPQFLVRCRCILKSLLSSRRSI